MPGNGALGEQYATEYLAAQGYSIVGRNFHTRYGEIDIIAQKGDILAFVEVKTRCVNALSQPAEAVSISKQKKLITAALGYLAQNPSDLQPRFDVIEIITKTKSAFNVVQITHLPGAFEVRST